MSTDAHGTVTPSYLSVITTPEPQDMGAYSNMSLRTGEVTRVIYPSDDDARSKRFIQYHVNVQQSTGGAASYLEYSYCFHMNPMAGLADWSHHTLRADKNPDNEGLGKGSKVLVLCINSEHNSAVILGGLRDEKDQQTGVKDVSPKKLKDLGHHLYGVFNGISWYIDKDGQFALTYNGKTDIDGSTNSDVDKAATGTHVALTSDGSFSIRTKDDKQFIAIDHKNKKILVTADKEWKVETSGDINIHSTGNTNLKPDQGLVVGQGTDHFLLGDTYRNNEVQMHATMTAALTAVQNAILAAGVSLVTAAAGLAIPLVGGTIAAPAVASAAGSIVGAGTIMAQLISAINTFEAQAPRYLSRLHKLD